MNIYLLVNKDVKFNFFNSDFYGIKKKYPLHAKLSKGNRPSAFL